MTCRSFDSIWAAAPDIAKSMATWSFAPRPGRCRVRDTFADSFGPVDDLLRRVNVFESRTIEHRVGRPPVAPLEQRMTLTTYGTKIDLRDVPPRDRAGLVSNTYRLLEPGQTMELVSDHDLQVFYHLLLERDPGGFSWHCLGAGSMAWRVRVARRVEAPQQDVCSSRSCSCS